MFVATWSRVCFFLPEIVYFLAVIESHRQPDQVRNASTSKTWNFVEIGYVEKKIQVKNMFHQVTQKVKHHRGLILDHWNSTPRNFRSPCIDKKIENASASGESPTFNDVSTHDKKSSETTLNPLFFDSVLDLAIFPSWRPKWRSLECRKLSILTQNSGGPAVGFIIDILIKEATEWGEK